MLDSLTRSCTAYTLPILMFSFYFSFSLFLAVNDHTQSSEISSSSSSSDTDSNSPCPVEYLPKLDHSTDKTPELQSLDVASTQTVQDKKALDKGSSLSPDRGNSPTPDGGKSLTPCSNATKGCESLPNESSKVPAPAPSESETPSAEELKVPDPGALESKDSPSADKMVQGQATAHFGRRTVTSEDVAKYFAMPSVNNMKVTLGLGGTLSLGSSPVLSKKVR